MLNTEEKKSIIAYRCQKSYTNMKEASEVARLSLFPSSLGHYIYILYLCNIIY
jgi:hypothetical protein